ncbi:MAG: hypothetical protein ABIR91_00550 [Candidatus Saccharimonadales bacterium]
MNENDAIKPKSIFRLDYQQDFPRTDISKNDAAMLGLMFQNEQIFQDTYSVIERESLLLRLGHKSILAGSQRHLLKHESGLLSLGFKTYFAITGLVTNEIPVHHNAAGGMKYHMENAFLAVRDNFERETTQLPLLFRNHRPNTSEVVETCAQRKFGAIVDYAIVGAALAYQLDMGTSIESN